MIGTAAKGILMVLIIIAAYPVVLTQIGQTQNIAGVFSIVVMASIMLMLYTFVLFLQNRKYLKEMSSLRDKLYEQHTWMTSILSSIGDGVVLADKSGKVTYINDIIQKISGVSDEELIGLSVKDVLDIINEKLQESSSICMEKDQENMKVEMPGYSEGCIDNLMLPVQDNRNGVIGTILILPNINECDRAHQIIHRMAHYDWLTGLANRTLINERLTAMLDEAKRNTEYMAVVFIDLDNFKSVNDTLGHDAGDDLLKSVSRSIESCIEKGDMVGRLGGDEFVVAISNFNSTMDVVKKVNKILEVINKPLNIGGMDFYITASAGIAIYPNHGDNVKTLLKNADTAMYEAKNSGKNTYQLYNNELNKRLSNRLNMENELRNAIKNEEFELFYQPQVDVGTGELVGVEALVRWMHPTKGIISPSEFIPFAEETGLILPIGEWILRKACIQNRIWQDMGYKPIRIAVNLSIKQFENENLVWTVNKILEETGLDPRWLELEITESIAVKCFDCAVRKINQLKGIGIYVSLDDFGTGYSSFNYLKQLPIDTLKIDKIFLDNLSPGSNEEFITRTIIDLARRLNLVVVAEGVETSKQLEFLKDHNCDRAQGYLFSRPISESQFENLLKTH